jgi:hypothetical protein
MNSLRYPAAFVTALLLNAGLAQAHPGHALHESDLSHLLASPYHLTVLVLMGVALLVGGAFVQRRLPRHFLQAGGALMLVAAVIKGLAA